MHEVKLKVSLTKSSLAGVLTKHLFDDERRQTMNKPLELGCRIPESELQFQQRR